MYRTRRFFHIDEAGVLRHLDSHKSGELRLVVPESLRAVILKTYHDDVFCGHQGIGATYDRIRKRFFWEYMYTDVARYVEACDTCLRMKSGQIPKHPLTTVPITEVFE